MTADTYPRPDFVRKDLDWTSLNGQWDFLFDDEDVGLVERWPHKSLPSSVSVNAPDTARDQSEAEKITQKIAAGTQNLIKDNFFQGADGSKVYQKREITVPFVYQTPASGINDRGAHEVLWYERSISDMRSDEAKQKNDRVLLRFGAVDYEATVWVNGQYVGDHQGGHVPFDIDITDSLTTDSTIYRLTVRVRDSTYDLTQPRGKQYWAAKPESIFYTPSSGIWQNVWLESVPAVRIGDGSHGTVLRSDDIETGLLHATIAVQNRRSGQVLRVEISATFHGVRVASETKDLPREVDTVTIDLPMSLSSDKIADLPKNVQESLPPINNIAWLNGVALWSPTHPSLYDLTITLSTSISTIDTIITRTGMRSLDWTDNTSTFRLNNRPVFQRLVLDQGYWPHTGITPPSPSSLRNDILLSQKMGFNGCRKHQKVEDPLFLHYANELGYLVWSEMGNAYSFSSTYVDRFDAEWKEAVKRDINHPCIVAWTPVNESWGYTDLASSKQQRDHIRSLVLMTKVLDPSRPVNDNCGWEHVGSDLCTFHDYSDAEGLARTCGSLEGVLGLKAGREVYVKEIRDAEGRVVDQGVEFRVGAPVICTEMGGVNIAAGKSDAEEWGYTTASSAADLLDRVERLVMGVVEGGIVCGFVYTQLCDIEQETNGLYAFRREEKLDAASVKKIFDRAEERYFELLEKRS